MPDLEQRGALKSEELMILPAMSAFSQLYKVVVGVVQV
jgi:hypothetical protein